MIPAHWLENTPSSEQKIFRLLRDDPTTSDWTVLHSLNLRQTGKLPYGEIDFVVLIPAGGIICLEVKGGRVSCVDGRWTSTDASDRVHSLKRSPFKQAQDGMHELRRALEERLPSGNVVRNIPFGFAVVFTDVDDVPLEIGSEPWEMIGQADLRSPLGSRLLKAATKQRQRLRIHSSPVEPQMGTMKQIRDLLRPDFEKVIARSTLIYESERRLIELTNEQYAIIDLLEGNLRCLFEGAAGTGKTLLALEFAKRCARRGQKVLLVCFNRLLADWFQRELSESSYLGLITAGSFYRCLRDEIVSSPFGEEFLEAEKSVDSDELFDNVYPLYGQLALESCERKFDVLVMDEAQDLLQRPILEVLDLWLSGGTRGGRWAFFGDFHRQAIYGAGTMIDIPNVIDRACPMYAKARLNQNCRNTKRIGEETALLSGFESAPYKMGQVEGLPVDYRDFTEPATQSAALEKVLSRFASDPDIDPSDVVILSRYRLEQSAAAGLRETRDFQILPVGTLQNAGRHQRPTFMFATVQAFKGMESKIVVVCDVDRIVTDEDRSLLYVAMSRARSLLTVILHTRTKPAIKEAFGRRMSESWGRTQ